MKFSRQSLEDLEHETVEDVIVDHTRWAVVHRRIFKHEGRLYSTTYRVSATEYQDEEAYHDNEVECPEVEPVIVEVTQYREVQQVHPERKD